MTGNEIRARIEALAAITRDHGKLTRIFLSPEHKRANDLVKSWMEQAGMTARIDAIGNIVGRYEAETPTAPALVLGSHLDTVVDAGKFDGMLGVVSAIACIAEFHRAGRRFPFAVEVIGFADEEGVRFGATLLGSRAVAGSFDPAWLGLKDAEGITMDRALRDFGLDPERIGEAALAKDKVLAYVELHIEQGPVLQKEGKAVGTVTAINGASRFSVAMTGQAGHAGTVPMQGRRDALAAAAQAVLAVERIAGSEPALVGTVGKIDCAPGALNVIPGQCRFTIDLRAPSDAQRLRAADAVLSEIAAIARLRGVDLDIAKIHEGAAAPCAPWLMAQIDAAIAGEGHEVMRLPSGAGHDGMAMIDISDIGMIFVRCRDGISHNPAEAVSDEDLEAGTRVLAGFIANFRRV